MTSNWVPGMIKAVGDGSSGVRHCQELAPLLDLVRDFGYSVVEARADAGMIRVRFHGDNDRVIRAEIRATMGGRYRISVGGNEAEANWEEVHETLRRMLREEAHAGES